MKTKHFFTLTFILIVLASCSRSITGTITEVKADTVKLQQGFRFRILRDSIPKLGSTVTFTPTVNRKKINAKKVN